MVPQESAYYWWEASSARRSIRQPAVTCKVYNRHPATLQAARLPQATDEDAQKHTQLIVATAVTCILSTLPVVECRLCQEDFEILAQWLRHATACKLWGIGEIGTSVHRGPCGLCCTCAPEKRLYATSLCFNASNHTGRALTFLRTGAHSHRKRSASFPHLSGQSRS